MDSEPSEDDKEQEVPWDEVDELDRWVFDWSDPLLGPEE